MSKTYTSILAFTLLTFVGMSVSSASQDEHYRCGWHTHTLDLAQAQEDFKKFQNQIDIYYIDADWKFDLDNGKVEGFVKYYFTDIESNGEILFQTGSNINIKSVDIIGGSVIGYEHDIANEILTLNTTSQLPSNQILFLEYEFDLPDITDENQAGILADLVNTKEVYWSQTAAYDGKYWFPLPEYIDDKIDSLDINIVVPKGYSAGSQGLPDDRNPISLDNDFDTYKWSHRYPIAPYLISVAIAEYQIDDFMIDIPLADSLRVMDFYIKNAFRSRNSIQLYMEELTERMGVYPFANEKYGHCEVSGRRFSAMEHQTMSSMGNFSPLVVIHELVHQWVGNMVTCSNWNDMWLNEGITTFMTLHTMLDLPGADQASLRDVVMDRASNAIFPVAYKDAEELDPKPSWEIYDGFSKYSKGAAATYLMMKYIGEEAFFDAFRKYLRDDRFMHGHASTVEFLAFMEAETGIKLERFTDIYLYGTDIPSYNVTVKQEDKIEILIEQKDIDETFGFESEMTLFATTGRVTVPFTLDSKNKTLTLDKTDFEAELGQDYTITSLVFDPQNELLYSEVTRNVIINSVEDQNEVPLFYNRQNKSIELTLQSPITEIYLYSADGRQVLVTDQITTDVSYLKKGVYFYQINTYERFKSGKIFID
ncbi:MAG: M1 family aminopeptidase [Candidatus Kapaibacteriales bacterium]